MLPPEPRPGDIWKYLVVDGEPMRSPDPTNLTGFCWGICAPNRAVGMLTHHTVREHEDGTVSIRPNDGSTNSVLIKDGETGDEWHGYIEHNIWTPC